MTVKAVILCGGPEKGTRFRPLLAPKTLFPLAGRPVLYHHIKALSKVEGIREIYLIGGYEDAVFTSFLKTVSSQFPDLIVKYLKEYTAMGTAGGIYHYRDLLQRNGLKHLFVLHSDIAAALPLAEFKKFHESHDGVASLLGHRLDSKDPKILQYGAILTAEDNQQVIHYVDKPESFLSNLISSGVYLFDVTVFAHINKTMSNIRPSDGPVLSPAARVLFREEEDISPELLSLEQDVLAPLAPSKKLFVSQINNPWQQIKTAASALSANTLYLQIAQDSASDDLAPVSKANATQPEIIGPCYIDSTAFIEPGAKIGPNCSIGAGCKISSGVRIANSILLDNVAVGKNSCILYSVISSGGSIGPWARIDGAPEEEKSGTQTAISILGEDVTVKESTYVSSCIVLPHKKISSSVRGKVLL